MFYFTYHMDDGSVNTSYGYRPDTGLTTKAFLVLKTVPQGNVSPPRAEVVKTRVVDPIHNPHESRTPSNDRRLAYLENEISSLGVLISNFATMDFDGESDLTRAIATALVDWNKRKINSI